MTDEDRLAALEEGLAVASANDRLLAGYMRRTLAREAQTEAAQLEARLAPSGLVSGPSLRSGVSGGPDLGSPLMDRLRGDAGMSHSVAGSGLSGLSSGNLLRDPTLDHITAGLFTTSWVAHGYFWEGRYVLDSGSAPSTYVGVQIAADRLTDTFHSTSVLQATAYWAAGESGTVTLQFRSKHDSDATTGIVWPFTVASLRAFASSLDAATTAATITVSVLDSSATVLETSDPVDLLVLDEISAEGRPFVAYEGIDNKRWQVDITITGEGANYINLAEPSLAYSDEESPPAFQPLIGRWQPYPVTYGYSVNRTAVASVPDDTWTTVYFPSASAFVNHDMPNLAASSPWHDTTASSNEFNAPWTGLYAVTAKAAFVANASASRGVRIKRDTGGSVKLIVEATGRNVGATQRSAVVAHDIVVATEGDIFTMEAWQDSGAALNLSAINKLTGFSIVFLGWGATP